MLDAEISQGQNERIIIMPVYSGGGSSPPWAIYTQPGKKATMGIGGTVVETAMLH